MRKVIYASEAVRAFIVAVAILVVLSVFPLRIWQRNIEEKGGGVRMEVSERVDDAHDLMQRFVARYDRLGTVKISVRSVESGRYLDFSLLDENWQRMYHKYVDIGIHEDDEYPVTVEIPVGAVLEPGKEYALFFLGAHAGIYLDLENIPADASPYFTGFYMNDTGNDTWRLNATLNYRAPIDKKASLMIIAAVILIAAVLERAVWFAAKRRGKDRDRVVSVRQAVAAFAVPPILLACTVLLVFCLSGRYDDRPADNAVYITGILIAAALGVIVFAAEKKGGSSSKITNVIEFVQAVAFALAVKYCCDYMNGLYDAVHRIAERKEVAAIAVFLIPFLFRRDRSGKKGQKINIFGALAMLFFVMTVMFRNGRMWGITVTVIFLTGLVCYRFSGAKDRYIPVLAAGLQINFYCSMLYCLLHRYFAAFVSGRFSFVFHTVTVTAEYLTMMGCAAFALLYAAVRNVPKDSGARGVIRAVLPEFVFFGTVFAYALFTASRTVMLALGVSVLVMFAVMSIRPPKGFRPGVLAAMTALSAVVMLTPVFTLQRIIPPMIGRPEYMEIEDAAPELRGWTNWDSRFLMSVERFSDVLLDKLAGVERGSYNYPEDRYNYDENGEYIYNSVSELAEPLRGGGGNPASSGGLIEEGNDADRMANGRLTIWRSYLPYLNLTGHEGMGVPLPNGEIAVHAHNVYLQVAYDNGIPVGILFAFTLCAAAFAGAVWGRMKGAEAFVPFALTVGFMVSGLSEWNYQLGNMMTVSMVLSWMPLCFRKK
ncbi:MAG: O-antigen ligase family protein [Lachnospiraceae bacterium]|nr:O-antigen ligase family protein [Lachnospiraceae bacterium]